MKNSTLKSAVVALAVAATMTVNAQSINFPQASPTASFTQGFATSKIEVSYSRPSAKGRKIFGDLVPFGKVWRTGANGATTISFGEDVKLNGTDVKAGKYGLLSIPGESEWTVILTKDLNVTSPGAYKQENDVARIAVKTTKLPYTAETFTIEVDNIKTTEADLEIKWENTAVVMKVVANIDEKLNKQIDEVMAKDSRPYFQSAAYYLESGKDLNKALVWVNKALESNPNAFWVLHVKAKIQKGLKDYNGALATAQLSLDKAKADGNADYVKNNENLMAEIKALPDYKAPKKK
jgi:hypothetical protein